MCRGVGPAPQRARRESDLPSGAAAPDERVSPIRVGWGSTHFTRRVAVRIDHVLCEPGARRGRVGPADRPVIADLEWVPPER
jgi:hypothetical protein